MVVLFTAVFVLLIVQRVGELILARKNEKWMKDRGAIECGEDHYKYIVMLHIGFLLAVAVETALRGFTLSLIWTVMLGIFLLAQLLRVWTIRSLGKFWNTKIIVLPKASVVAKGPYRFLRHPNYVIVALEILSLPLIFSSYWTAIVFTFLNAGLLLKVRIPAEEKALKEVTNYTDVFTEPTKN
ncbi:isoprenylcysteine carboxyl methyltransferase family protein [Pseudalkalibacillus hwajinpoensis]|uniref:Isoprenylcysteine carboxyl methyltransferase n=1 Tax=Guptibacillus hwajinpoensis TaxID=208199 RepID=A0A4U1MFA2_9BACL|nr:isoprenylcysteine carboxylmethyltransferase family protein [Pseudalkalibacillus hwajinpoensis]TKD69899.1 isoprenylcysteine carboxyl methyltransferase [Pseudalkalibacillus hwajinpoensis]